MTDRGSVIMVSSIHLWQWGWKLCETQAVTWKQNFLKSGCGIGLKRNTFRIHSHNEAEREAPSQWSRCWAPALPWAISRDLCPDVPRCQWPHGGRVSPALLSLATAWPGPDARPVANYAQLAPSPTFPPKLYAELRRERPSLLEYQHVGPRGDFQFKNAQKPGRQGKAMIWIQCIWTISFEWNLLVCYTTFKTRGRWYLYFIYHSSSDSYLFWTWRNIF